MSRFPVLIHVPGGARPLSLLVRETTTIAACLTCCIEHLALAHVDAAGHHLIYTLRLASDAAQPLPEQGQVRDLHLTPRTHLLLEVHAEEQARIAPPPLLHRRAVLATGGFLALCAVGGLSLGVATGLAQHLRNPARVSLSLVPPASPISPSVEALSPLLRFAGHQQTVRTVAWSPDGSLLASGADDGQALLWQTQGLVRHHLAHPAPVLALVWSPEGQRLVTAAGNQVQFFAVAEGAKLAPTTAAHLGTVTSLAWAQAAGQPVISGARDQRAIVWDSAQYQPRAAFTGHDTTIEALCVLPQSTLVASASHGGAVRLWQAQTVQEVHADYEQVPVPIHALAFAPTIAWLLAGGDDGRLRLWSHARSCEQVMRFDGAPHCSDAPLEVEVHTTPIRALAWSPDGRILATGGDNGLLALWTLSPQQGLTLLASARQSDPVLSLCWSPDQRCIAAAAGRTITLWQVSLPERAPGIPAV